MHLIELLTADEKKQLKDFFKEDIEKQKDDSKYFCILKELEREKYASDLTLYAAAAIFQALKKDFNFENFVKFFNKRLQNGKKN
jgi:hypothetical protein